MYSAEAKAARRGGIEACLGGHPEDQFKQAAAQHGVHGRLAAEGIGELAVQHGEVQASRVQDSSFIIVGRVLDAAVLEEGE